MFRPYEIFVGSRYLRSRSRNRFVSFISLISVFGIALSVAVLIVVLSVMNGFEHEVRARILAVLSHASITGQFGELADWRQVQELAEVNERVTGSAPFVSAQGMLAGATGVAGIELRGILPAREAQVSGIGGMLRSGSLSALESRAYRIILGSELAARLGAGVGDKVVLMTAQGAVTPAGLTPRSRRFEVAGIFHAGMYEYDKGLAYVHLDDAARVYRLGDAVSGVSLTVEDPLEAARVVREVAMSYGGGVYISDWTRQHANFFRSIELTKSIIFFILLMVVAVAVFNIVSTLIMVVKDKATEIAILRSIGASAASILGVFVTEGVLIGAVGTLLGVAAGWLLALNIGAIVSALESLLQIRFVSPDVYFISELPSRVETGDVRLVGGIAFLLVVAATVYPALRGAATNPASALRHE